MEIKLISIRYVNISQTPQSKITHFAVISYFTMRFLPSALTSPSPIVADDDDDDDDCDGNQWPQIELKILCN